FLGAPYFSPDGKSLFSLFTANPSSDGSLWRWDLSTGQGRQSIDFEGKKVRGASFSADGKTLAVLLIWYTWGSSRHDRVEVWDTTHARRVGSLIVRSPWMSTVALSPDGKHVAVGFQQPHLHVPAPIGIWRVD